MNKIKSISSYIACKTSSNRQRQLLSLDKKIQQSDHLHFIKYWGGSNKQKPDQYDLWALIKLFAFLRTIEKTYNKDVQLTLVFTDTHVDLNGYPAEGFINYFRQIAKIIKEYNFHYTFMSEIISPYMKCHGLNDIKAVTTQIITQALSEIKPALPGNKIITGNMSRSAGKHSYRFTHNQFFTDLRFETPDQAAYAYLILNQLEKPFIECRFKESIFITYASEDEQMIVAPNLTIVQIFSYRSGVRSRPWFSQIEELNNKKICVA